ncbi:MAG: tRNA 2-thiocytidine(32) synthetase TtcA [Bdellovibrionaceae bacterium]|nr:tRNA 2-thiocytidine(32) synthetase TtcA [Pseudobdellovibrionaceae bacterium]
MANPMHVKIDYEYPLAVKVRKEIVKALNDFDMIKEGDHIVIGVSGGKDSTILSLMFKEIKRRSALNFTFECLCLDQKQPGFDPKEFKNFYENQDLPLSIIEKDTYTVVKEKTPEGGTYCTLCSKFRRAILYDQTSLKGAKKLALGHHRDDLIQTLLLNMFYVGHIASMPPKLLNDQQSHVVIRPMCYVSESDLINLAQHWSFPIIPCNLCGSQDGLKRKRMKKLVQDLEKEIPNLSASLLSSMAKITPSQLMDRDLSEFKTLETLLK